MVKHPQAEKTGAWAMGKSKLNPLQLALGWKLGLMEEIRMYIQWSETDDRKAEGTRHNRHFIFLLILMSFPSV